MKLNELFSTKNLKTLAVVTVLIGTLLTILGIWGVLNDSSMDNAIWSLITIFLGAVAVLGINQRWGESDSKLSNGIKFALIICVLIFIITSILSIWSLLSDDIYRKSLSTIIALGVGAILSRAIGNFSESTAK